MIAMPKRALGMLWSFVALLALCAPAAEARPGHHTRRHRVSHQRRAKAPAKTVSQARAQNNARPAKATRSRGHASRGHSK